MNGQRKCTIYKAMGCHSVIKKIKVFIYISAWIKLKVIMVNGKKLEQKGEIR